VAGAHAVALRAMMADEMAGRGDARRAAEKDNFFSEVSLLQCVVFKVAGGLWQTACIEPDGELDGSKSGRRLEKWKGKRTRSEP